MTTFAEAARMAAFHAIDSLHPDSADTLQRKPLHVSRSAGELAEANGRAIDSSRSLAGDGCHAEWSLG